MVVPITFGRALVDPYGGFPQYTVEPNDTLSGIARRFYGDGNPFPRVCEANRNQVHGLNLIFPGLRIPP